jgi:dTDP-4-amino-4,6-dideoxygalactose transaminase
MPSFEMKKIPLYSSDIGSEEIDLVNQVLRTPYLGPMIERFEQAVATYLGVRHAVAVSSGTAGLHLAVIATGVNEGDTVITTPFSFVASANVILYERAIPVFVDVDSATGNINPSLVAECADDLSKGGSSAKRWLPLSMKNSDSGTCTERSRSIRNLKSILPVHSFGQPADMDPIIEMARRNNLMVIEDACEAIGAEYKGRKVGTMGDAAVFSFYPNKQMTTGEGGMIVTKRDDWDSLFRSLRNQGRDVFNEWLNHERLGYNYYLDELSSALGLVQLKRIEELLAKREQVANWYNERLVDTELFERPHIASATTRMSWFVYVVRIKPPAYRDEIMRRLAEAGIPSQPYFTPIHLQPFYRKKFGYQRGDFPITEYLGDISLALPFSGIMIEDQVDYVCNALRKILKN